MNKLQLASEQLKLLRAAQGVVFKNAKTQYVGKMCVLNTHYFDTIKNAGTEDIIYLYQTNGGILRTNESLDIKSIKMSWSNSLSVEIVYNSQSHFIDVEYIDLV